MVLVSNHVKYLLTVAPDMAHVKKGMWTTQSFTDINDALALARAFEKLGAIWYLETVETKKVSTRGSKPLTDWWGE